MKLRWGKAESKYFSKPIKKAECTNDVMWWGIFGALVVMEAAFIAKILGYIQEVNNMIPTAQCQICGKVYHGWALKYKTCKCCGKVLKVKS